MVRVVLATISVAVLVVVLGNVGYAAGALPKNPNFVVLFADDLGYGDLTGYGHPTIYTPNLDALMRNGRKYTQWYSGWALCSPSRAALLTGRIPLRVGMGQVLSPDAIGGIPSNETLLSELLKEHGYATGIVGKWHLGQQEQYLPTQHGFDYYWGVPYSVDMGGQFAYPCAPNTCTYLPLLQNNSVVQQPVNLNGLEMGYAKVATTWIEQNKNKPFFFYLPFSHAHVSLGARQWCSSPFNNTSSRGLYGDAVQELDWVVGQVVQTLEANNLLENTLVIFTSDNGPWLQTVLNGGSAGLFYGGKGSTWEGGLRMPAIAMWKGVIEPASVSQQLFSTMDVFTTILSLAGIAAPSDRIIDGIDVKDALLGNGPSPHDFMFFWNGMSTDYRLCAVRAGDYKVHYVTGSTFSWAPVVHNPPLLFNIAEDPSEQMPLNVTQYQSVIAAFDAAVVQHKKEMVFAVDQVGRGSDRSLAICCNKQTNCVCGQ